MVHNQSSWESLLKNFDDKPKIFVIPTFRENLKVFQNITFKKSAKPFRKLKKFSDNVHAKNFFDTLFADTKKFDWQIPFFKIPTFAIVK